MLLAQYLSFDERASDNGECGNTCIKDPHIPQTPCERFFDREFLRWVLDHAHDHDVRSGRTAGQNRSDVGG